MRVTARLPVGKAPRRTRGSRYLRCRPPRSKKPRSRPFQSNEPFSPSKRVEPPRDVAGRHYFETRKLYDAALLAGFERGMLADRARLRYYNLVPNPRRRPQSSLGYMMGRVSETFGTDAVGWYVDGDRLDIDGFVAGIRDAQPSASRAVCIATTAFALVGGIG